MKLDIHRILKSKFMGFSALTILASVLNFAFLPLIANALSVEDFGLYILIYTAVQVGAQVFLFGMTTLLSKEISGSKSELSVPVLDFFNNFSKITLLILILFAISFSFIIGGSALLVLMVVLIIFVRSWYRLIVTYFRMKEELLNFALFQLVFTSCFFGFPIAYSSVSGSIDITEFFAFMLLGYLVCLIFLRRLLIKRRELTDQPISLSFFSNNKSILVFGAGAALHSASGALLTVADRFISAFYMSANEFGVYALASQLAAVLSLTFTAIVQSMVPDFYRKLNQGYHGAIFVDYMKNLLIMVVIIVCLYQIFLAAFVELFFSDSYMNATYLARLLSIGIVFQGLYSLSSAYLFYKKKSILMSKLSFSIGGFGVLLGFLLGNFYGIFGIIVAFIITWFFMFVVTTFYCKRVFNEFC